MVRKNPVVNLIAVALIVAGVGYLIMVSHADIRGYVLPFGWRTTSQTVGGYDDSVDDQSADFPFVEQRRVFEAPKIEPGANSAVGHPGNTRQEKNNTAVIVNNVSYGVGIIVAIVGIVLIAKQPFAKDKYGKKA